MPFPAVHPALDRALASRGYAEPTSVQLAVVEADRNPERPHADMLVSAQTGSGKTVAFGLGMVSTLLGEAERFEKAGKPLALVIAPTRELAIQIVREFEWLYAETGARIVQCVGGMSVRAEQGQLERGAHIVVGTPGRLCDHLDKEYLDLSELKVAVLDEADEMLDLGFREELETLLKATPESRRTLLFSATIARGIAMLAKNYQRDAVRIDTTSATEPHGDIEYRAMRVSPGDTEKAVVNVLRYFEAGRALVFCHTREAVRHLYASLRERGFSAVGMSGEMGQRERNDALQALRDGHAKVCVATDVAARGLDLPDLGLVIHADLPSNKATLLHRSGRTGRAGKKGVSVLLVTHSKRRRTEMVLQSANIEAIWSAPPSADDIRAQDRTRLLEHPALGAAVSEDDQQLAKQLAERVTPEQLAGALIGLLRADLPEPEDVGDDVRMRDTQSREPRERALPRTREEKGFASDGDGVWFRLNVGRERKADPKWILPLVCRVGNVTRNEIGPIRIFADETKFEIVGHAAEAFAAAIRENPDSQVRIEPSSPPGPGDSTHPARARREDGVRADRAPREKRGFGDRPPREGFKRSGRDEARATRYKQREDERAIMAADPVMSSLAPAAEKQTPPHVHPSGLNRKQRRDAARASGDLAPIVDTPAEQPRRTWTPDADAAPMRRERTQPSEAREHRKPEGFKSRGPKPEGFKPRGPKPEGFKSRGPKPDGYKPRGDRPEGFKPRGPKPEGFAPRGARGEGFKPRGPKGEGKSFAPRGDKVFRGDKPFRAFDKPGGNKTFRGKPKRDRG